MRCGRYRRTGAGPPCRRTWDKNSGVALEGDAERDADEANPAARTRGANGLQHRFLRTDALEDGIGAHSLRQFLDARHAFVTALG